MWLALHEQAEYTNEAILETRVIGETWEGMWSIRWELGHPAQRDGAWGACGVPAHHLITAAQTPVLFSPLRSINCSQRILQDPCTIIHYLCIQGIWVHAYPDDWLLRAGHPSLCFFKSHITWSSVSPFQGRGPCQWDLLLGFSQGLNVWDSPWTCSFT